MLYDFFIVLQNWLALISPLAIFWFLRKVISSFLKYREILRNLRHKDLILASCGWRVIRCVSKFHRIEGRRVLNEGSPCPRGFHTRRQIDRRGQGGK